MCAGSVPGAAVRGRDISPPPPVHTREDALASDPPGHPLPDRGTDSLQHPGLASRGQSCRGAIARHPACPPCPRDPPIPGLPSSRDWKQHFSGLQGQARRGRGPRLSLQEKTRCHQRTRYFRLKCMYWDYMCYTDYCLKLSLPREGFSPTTIVFNGLAVAHPPHVTREGLLSPSSLHVGQGEHSA